MTSLPDIWAYLSASPLLHLTLTLATFVMAVQIARLGQSRAWLTVVLNPVLVSVAIIVTLLAATGTAYATYFAGAQFVHFLLGPATVALAIPLYRQLPRVRAAAPAILGALAAGSVTAVVCAVTIGALLGGSRDALVSLAPKSVTAPVAMGITEQLGGLPSLTAVLVIATGLLGAMVGPALLARLGVRDPAAVGLALGTASHGIGTARALALGETAGAFSGLAMGLNALLTALLLPLVWRALS